MTDRNESSDAPLDHEAKRALLSPSTRIPMKEDFALRMPITTVLDTKPPFEKLPHNGPMASKYGTGIKKPSNCTDVSPSNRIGVTPCRFDQRIDCVESPKDDLSDLDNILDAFDTPGPSTVPTAFPTFPQLQRTASLPPPSTSSSSHTGSRDLSIISRRQTGSIGDIITISRLRKRVKEAESARHIAESARDDLILSHKELSHALSAREREVSNAALVKEALVGEISSLSGQLNGLCVDKEALHDEIARIVKQLNRLEEMRDSLAMEKDDMELRLERDFRLMQATMDDMNRDMEHLVQSNIELSFQLSAALSANIDLDVQLEASVAVEAQHLHTIHQLTEDRDALRKDIGFAEEAKLEMVTKMNNIEHHVADLEKENDSLKMQVVESFVEEKASTKRIADVTRQLHDQETTVEELKAALDAAAVREADLNTRNTKLETDYKDVSQSLTMEQEHGRRATRNVACLQSELGEAHKRSSSLRAEIADLKDEADILRRDLKLTESRCKILGMELDRPLWETAKQQRERVEKEEREEALREATRKYMEKMAKAERASAAEEARIQRENQRKEREEAEKRRRAEEARVRAEEERRAEAARAEEERKRKEAERRQRQEAEMRRQAEQRRHAEAAEQQRQAEEAMRRMREAESERMRRAQADRAFWERTEREKRAAEEETYRQNRWRQATQSEQARCSARDFEIWPGVGQHWSRSIALSRFQTIMGEFSTIQFSETQPLTMRSVPWPSLDIPPTVITNITEGRYGWNDVDAFFKYAKAHMVLGEYQTMVKTSRLCFHPDKWAGRNLLISVQDEGVRALLKDAGNSVSQSVNAITIRVPIAE